MVTERPPEWWPQWLIDLNLRFDIFVKKLRASQVRPWDIDEQEPEQKEKLQLLYNEMMEDINASDVSENIKTGLDPVPAMVGFLLAAAGGGAISMLLGSLLMPYIQSKLTYPMQRQAEPYRLPPDIVFRLAWKLYKGEDIPEELLGDLRDQGFDQGRIEKGLEASKVVPSPTDIIAFLAHEVFEPDMVKKYGLDEEFEAIDLEPALKIGLDKDTLRLYWRNHWQHTSFTQMIQLRRREIIKDEDVWEWFRLVEIPPHWRDMLIQLMWAVPTRVDVRRFWDMGTIDETRLRKLYTAMGYEGENLEDYVLWTKVYVAFPDLIARYKNTYISQEDVFSELVALGMTRERAEVLWQTKIKPATPARTLKERDLTASEIIRGVKKGIITREKGAELLVAMRWSQEEAEFKLAINIPEDKVEAVVAQRELSKADILKGLKTKTLDVGEAVSRFAKLRYTPADADLLIKIYTTIAEKPTEESLRQESKADIVKAVKKGLIKPEEGYLRLLDLAFAPEAADFILSLIPEDEPFSPASLTEFVELVNAYKRSVGVDVHATTEAALEAERAYIEAQVRLREARQRGEPQAEVRTLEALVAETKARFEAALAQSQES